MSIWLALSLLLNLALIIYFFCRRDYTKSLEEQMVKLREENNERWFAENKEGIARLAPAKTLLFRRLH